MVSRFMLDDAGELIDLKHHKFVDYGEECCNLLNDLAEENQSIKSKHMEMLDFIEEKGTVTVNDIKQWWNTTR